MVNHTQSDLLTVHEVAIRLRVGETTMRLLVSSDALEAITLPHRSERRSYRIKREVVEDLLNGKAVGHAGTSRTV